MERMRNEGLNIREKMVRFYNIEEKAKSRFFLQTDWLLENAVYPSDSGYAGNLMDLWNVYMPEYKFEKIILEYNPEITVNTYKIRLDENNYQSIVKDYDVIIDCFDSYKSKILLNDIAVETGKTLIHGGVTEYFGQVTVIKPSTPCLRCIFPDIDLGKEVPKGILSPVVSTVASIPSMEAVKQILNTGEPLEGLLLTYNALTNDFKKLKITKNTACKCYKKI